MDAAEYKHLVLGLIFVKYISDTFAARRAELTRRFADEADDYFLHDCDDGRLLAAELEDRDYYRRSTSSGCRKRPAGKRSAPPPSNPTSASASTTR
jgi:type I restriction-modification system DNA methylase subunit